MSRLKTSKNKLRFLVSAVAVTFIGILLYTLQFSARSFQLECSRQANRCILQRDMVIGGLKQDVILLDHINKTEVSHGTGTSQSVWLVIDTRRLPIGSFSKRTNKATRLVNDFEAFLNDPQQEKFSYQSSEF
jgi:hypothetical protein